MDQLRGLIDELIKFGVASEKPLQDSLRSLQKLLVKLYVEFLDVEVASDDTQYAKPPHFEYNDIRRNVVSNFPELGWYATVLSTNAVGSDNNLGTGDAVDDLTDIIMDLLEVKWRIENTSEVDAVWHFHLLMSTHSEQHLLDLLKYIKEQAN